MRISEKSRRPVSISLHGADMKELAVKINRSLKEEEQLRLKSVREEKRFKEMIANISHDLRTPLTAVKGYQQLLCNSGLSENQQEKLTTAMKHTDELGQLIDHFFEYSYILNSEPVIRPERINLTNFVTECIVDSIPMIENNSLTVDMEESNQIYTVADKELLMRIISNLIRNCVQHAEDNFTVKVWTSTDSEGRMAAVSFTNKAVGITENDLERLFERFYTADRARQKSTGLGLSIVRLLAEQMDGRAEAEIRDGMLKISVKLPLAER